MSRLSVLQIPRRFVAHAWGGTETVILETSKRLHLFGIDSRVLCPNALATTSREVLQGVQIERLPYFYPYLHLRAEAREQLDQKGGNLFSFSLMAELLSRQPLHLIHLHTGKRLGGIGRYVARRRGLPYIVSLHGGVFDIPPEEARSFTVPSKGSFEWGKALGWWVGSRKVLDDADAIVCVGKKERDLAAHHFPHKRVVHLPHGVDTRKFAHGNGARFRLEHAIPKESRVVLNVGRIDPQKSQLTAVDALARLSAREPKWHLVLIGPVTDANYAKRLRERVHAAGMSGRTTIIPGLDANSQQLVDSFAAANAFILPSAHEPFGIVVLEAWAAGLPVLASQVGGLASLIREGTDGLLVPPQDPDALARALVRLEEEPKLAAALAENGRLRVAREMSWETITGKLAELYEEVLRERPLRA